MSAAHSKKQYFVVFIVLVALTILEVAVAKMLKEQKGVMIALLISMAVTKAGFVAMYYMHLASERRALKLVVGIPLLFPPFYAIVLMAEAVARYAIFR